MQTTDAPRQAARGRSVSRATSTIAALPLPLVVVMLVLFAVSPGVPFALALLASVALAALWWVFLARAVAQAETSLLGELGTELGITEMDPVVAARMHNLVDGLCLTMGLNKPRMWVVRAGFPLAMTVSEPGSTGSLVFSEGLIESLDRVESEALATHMLVRLRSGDAETATSAIALWRSASRFGLGRLATLALARTARIEPSHLVDAAACRVTRYPPGLVSVLGRFVPSAGGRAVNADAVTDVPHRLPGLWVPLMFADPDQGDARAVSDLPNLETVRLSVGERIELLKEY